MATIRNKLLFFTTSPRTPVKMIPEIRLLNEKYAGSLWDNTTQIKFAEELASSEFFEGKGFAEDKAFSARDRINRAPKALGFVDLSPIIELTDAGKGFVQGKRPEEAFLRQLLKFQLPSPYHVENDSIKGTFCIRPYLEVLRLIRELGYITFDEFKIFAVQMTDYHNFEQIKHEIEAFRSEKETNKGRYKQLANKEWENAILRIYGDRIAQGKTRTRESNDASIKKFISTQKSNMRDYADACFRYLRYTGLVAISNESRSISIFEYKHREVDFILATMPREPIFIDDLKAYKRYLFSATEPVLYTDNRDNLVEQITALSPLSRKELVCKSVEELKDLKDDIVLNNKKETISKQVANIKTYALFSEIINTFKGIQSRDYYDAPLMFEYNSWRAMTMLNGGDIKGNFVFDDAGQPLSTAPGNVADIECDYKDFSLSVEVTLQTGQRQYESEGEPVARHYGQLKKKTGKDTYCLFVAPRINPAALAHFYGLNHFSISLYGGKSKIIPLELNQFIQLIKIAYNNGTPPVPSDIRSFLDAAMDMCERATDEENWRNDLQVCVDTWMMRNRQ